MNYQMRLIDLMSVVESDTVSTTLITGMSLDSRQLKPRDLFIALATNPEVRAQHIQQAIEADVTAVCYSTELPLEPELIQQVSDANIELVAVDQLNDRTSRLAAAFYQYPSAVMTIFAVTGTNGKTSVATFVLSLIHI